MIDVLTPFFRFVLVLHPISIIVMPRSEIMTPIVQYLQISKILFIFLNIVKAKDCKCCSNDNIYSNESH